MKELNDGVVFSQDNISFCLGFFNYLCPDYIDSTNIEQDRAGYTTELSGITAARLAVNKGIGYAFSLACGSKIEIMRADKDRKTYHRLYSKGRWGSWFNVKCTRPVDINKVM